MAYPASDPRLSAWLDAGLLAHQSGDIDRALAAYRQILTAAPEHPAALNLLGTGLLQLGHAADAVPYLERASRRQRDNAQLLGNLAEAYLALKRYSDAHHTFRKASRLVPTEMRFQVGIAAALAMAGKLDEAEALLERLTVRFADAPLVWLNFGNVRRDRRQPARAIEAYRRALELDPEMIEARNSVGSVLHSQQRFVEAEAEYRACLEAAPEYLKARYNLASLMMDSARLTEAEEIWRETVRQAPTHANAYRMLGTVLAQQKRLLEALACYRRASELVPDDPGTAQAYGAGLMESGYSADGLRWLARAAIDSPAAPLKRVTAGALLAHGCLQDAWPYHAARSGAAELRASHGGWDPDQTPAPPLAGSHVCIVGEQGLGDELFFLRYAPRLAALAKSVTYRASPRLQSLLQRAVSFEAVHAESARLPRADVYMLAGDLPLALGHTAQSPLRHVAKPFAQPGLFEPQRCISIFWPPPAQPLAIPPLPERVAAMRDRLAAAGPPPYFGVTWRAGIAPEQQDGATWALFKAIGVRELSQALHGLPGTVVSLQRAPEKGEADALAAALGRPVHDFTALNDDLESMLALLSLIDEYIGVSNTNVHLRAAAGKTARVLVPVPAEWRWMQAGRSSPWFAGFSIYRQSLQGDWGPALSALTQDLEAQWRSESASDTR